MRPILGSEAASDTGSSGSAPTPSRWWVRPAFGLMACGIGALMSLVVGWCLGHRAIPPTDIIEERVFGGVFGGLLWGFVGNWVASRAKRRHATCIDKIG